MSFPKAQKGVTLLEAILAVAIASSILVLSIKMYDSYKLQGDLEALQYNVDNLFQAMSLYYKANCSGSYNSSGTQSVWGTLNPDINNPSPPSLIKPKLITIANDLRGTNVYLKNWQPNSPIVNNAVGENGYVVQFDPILFNTNNVNALSSLKVAGAPAYTLVPGGAITSSVPLVNQVTPTANTFTATQVNPTAANQVNGHYMPPNQTTGLVWKLQVSVLLLDPTLAATYKAYLQADCDSDLTGSGSVEPCETPPAAQNGYLVWERLPSNASPEISTVNEYWMHNVSQFNLQYTHDQMYELIPTSKDQGGNTLRYYLCGG